MDISFSVGPVGGADALQSLDLQGVHELDAEAEEAIFGKPFSTARVPYKEHIEQLGMRGFIQQIAQRGEGLTTLDLSDNDLGEAGVRELSEALAEHRHLRRLNLARTGLGANGFKEVGALLCDSPMIETLVMSGNSPGPQALPHDFCDMFRVACSLKSLNLSRCGLTAASLRPLADAFSSGGYYGIPPLERLDLAHNELEAPAVTDVCRFLAFGEALRVLDMTANRLGPKGGEALARELADMRNSPLENLHLGKNGLALRGCQALARFWAVNAGGHQLRRLDLRDNGTSEAQCAELSKTLGMPHDSTLNFGNGAQVLLSWHDRQGSMARKTHGGHEPLNVFWRS